MAKSLMPCFLTHGVEFANSSSCDVNEPLRRQYREQ